MNFLQRHPRLATSLALGIAAALVPFRSAEADSLHLHFLVGWNVTVWTYLALIGWLMVHAGHERARAISEGEDPSAILALMLVLLMVIASLIAIGLELARASSPLHYANAAVTLLGSWLMLNTLFTFHYAHLYFRAAPDARPLRFPDKPPPDPDFWDFFYFSFTIAVAAQTADISVVSGAMRKVVVAHAIVSFFFNVAILGATINVVAGLLH